MEGLLDVEVEDVGDGFVFVEDLAGLAAEAGALADGAGDPEVGEEIHLDLVGAVALAGLATAAALAGVNIETEASGLVAAELGVGQFSEEESDLIEELDVGGGVAAWGAPDRGLIDGDNLVEVVESVEGGVWAGLEGGGVV